MVTQTCDLVERLLTIPDPRRQCRNLKHRLVDILVLGFCGTLAGCDDFVEIADWATDNAEFLGTFLELPTVSASSALCCPRPGRNPYENPRNPLRRSRSAP